MLISMSLSKTTIYLIRHGDVINPDRINYGRTYNVALSDLGKRQIKRTAEKISAREEKPIIIMSSPLRRTQESSRVISNHFHEIPITLDDRLLETDAHKIDGTPMDSFTSHQDPYGDPALELERPEYITSRMFTALESARMTHDGHVICLVSHGDPLAFLMWKLMNPQGSIPPMGELGKQFYLKRSESWRVVFDEKGNVSEYEYLPQELVV